MLTVSQRWQETITRDDRVCLGYITLGNTTIDRELFSYKILDTVYDDDFTGSFVKKKCDIQVLNKQREFAFDNQRIGVYAGLKYEDNTTEYLFLGTYIVTTAKYDDVNYLSTLECYDLSTLFDIPYISKPDLFPCTFREYLTYCCNQCGVVLSQNSFNLENEVLTTEPYLDSGSTYRDAIRQLTKVCLSNAQIIQDQLVISGVKKNTIDFELHDFFELTTEAAMGPYNVLTLSRVPQEDNYPYPQQVPNNPIEYRVENNQIVDKEREIWAPKMYPYIQALTFIPNKIQLLKGRPEITAMDRYKYYDMEENQKITMVFTHEFEYNGVFISTLSCQSKTQTQTNYKRAGTLEKRVATTELWVDKAAGEIASLIQDMYAENGVVNTNYSQIYQTLQTILLSVQSSGGNNLLYNSVGYANTESWTTTGDNISTSVSVEIQENSNSGGAFILDTSSIKQRVTVKMGDKYSFSCKVKKGAESTGRIKIFNNNEEYIITLGETTEEYSEFTLKGITATTNYYDIELKSNSGEILFTDIMFNNGELISQWQQANGEVLNTQVNITNNGVLVKAIQFEETGQYTVISPLEFAGYAKVNGIQTKVFTINGDTTEVEKLKSRSGIDMPPIKIVPITGSINNGWAFVPDGSE